MPNSGLVRRSYNFDIRASEENDGIVELTGRPIVYNSRTDLGWFDEIIMPGALDSADLTDVRFLVNHDTKMIPLARSRRNNARNNTMQLSTDAMGMSMDWIRLDVKNNEKSRALASAVSRGDMTCMSFMFSIDGEEWEDLESDHPTRKITKIGSVVEISAVTFPAYEATEINERCKQALDSARAALDSARRDRSKSLDSDLELLKEKTKILCGM